MLPLSFVDTRDGPPASGRSRLVSGRVLEFNSARARARRDIMYACYHFLFWLLSRSRRVAVVSSRSAATEALALA